MQKIVRLWEQGRLNTYACHRFNSLFCFKNVKTKIFLLLHSYSPLFLVCHIKSCGWKVTKYSNFECISGLIRFQCIWLSTLLSLVTLSVKILSLSIQILPWGKENPHPYPYSSVSITPHLCMQLLTVCVCMCTQMLLVSQGRGRGKNMSMEKNVGLISATYLWVNWMCRRVMRPRKQGNNRTVEIPFPVTYQQSSDLGPPPGALMSPPRCFLGLSLLHKHKNTKKAGERGQGRENTALCRMSCFD